MTQISKGFWEREWKTFGRHLWFGGVHTGLSQLNKFGIFSVLWKKYLGICGAEEHEVPAGLWDWVLPHTAK